MAEIVGLNGLHNLEGFKCDLCSLPCDPQAQELNALDCTFSNCPSDASVYHQDCLEKYLKSVKLEKNRKTGFKCPRGCGKGSRFDQPCPGKITKSHPIHIRNDQSKKRQKALPPPPLEYKPKVKEKNKDASPAEKGKDVGKNKDSAVDKGKAKAVAAVPAKQRQVVPIHNPKPPVPNKHVEKQQIENIRREIAAKCGKATGVPQTKAVPAKEKDFQTLHEYEAHKEASQPKANAWGARNNAARVLNVPPQQPQLQPPPPPPPPPPPKPVQAGLPAASSWALAARQPPPPALAAKPKAAAANGPVRAVSIWSTQQEHADAQPPPPPPKPTVTLVGGELAEPEVPVKIGKAAKKNMKRLEKRAKERAATDTSVASSDIVSDMYPETISEGDNEGETLSEARAGEEVSSLLRSDSREDGNGDSYSGSDGLEAQTGDHPRCIQALMATKARWLLGQLQLLGFPDWQCAVAVLRCGSDLHGAIAFLLEEHVTSEEQSRAYMASAVESPDIDITEELQMLAEAQSCLGLPMSVVEKAVADADGDIQAGVNALLGQSAESKPDRLHASHSEGHPQLQTHPSEAPSQPQADTKQRRSSADISRPSVTATASPSGPTKMATPWASQGSQAQPHLSNGHHAGLDPWLSHQAQQQEQEQQQTQQQQHVPGPSDTMTFTPWHKDPAAPSPFAAAAAQPPPPPPKQSHLPALPRPVELPATLEPQLQSGLGEFLPAGSAGLLSAKLGQHYTGTSSSGYAQTSQQQAPQQQPLEQEGVPYGSRLSSYTSAASRTATPKAADCSSWNGSLDSSASYAAAQGLGQAIPSLSSFSMFSAPSAAAAGRAADPWGSSAGSTQMANLERYNQLLQQSPGGGSGRSSFDSSHAPLPGSSTAAQRHVYLPSLSPGSSVSQASFSGYNMTQQPQASWGMLPLHSSAQSIWSSTPADRLGAGAPEAALLAAAAVAVDEPRRADAGGRDTSDADLELDSLMATLMCT